MLSRWSSRDAHLVTKRPWQIKSRQPSGPHVSRRFHPRRVQTCASLLRTGYFSGREGQMNGYGTENLCLRCLWLCQSEQAGVWSDVLFDRLQSLFYACLSYLVSSVCSESCLLPLRLRVAHLLQKSSQGCRWRGDAAAFPSRTNK